MDRPGKCSICKVAETYSYVEITPGTYVYVCPDCIEKAEDNFIWLCMSCGNVYIRPKELVINRIKEPELKRAYMLCADMKIIQGIDMCVACDPERILHYMECQYSNIEC
jgi:hypothetical protein